MADRATALPYGNGTQPMIFFSVPSVDAQGNVVFQADTGSNGQAGVYALEHGVLTRIIDNTQDLPGSNVKFGADGAVDNGPAIGGGQVAYFSNNGTGLTTGHYGINAFGNPAILVTYGSPPPGSGSDFYGLGPLSLDPGGAYAFGGGNATTAGLFYSAGFGGGSYSPIIQYQDFLAVEGQYVKEARSGIFALSGDQFAFDTSFFDGSSGVFIATRQAVPEPTSLALLATGLAVAGLARRRRA